MANEKNSNSDPFIFRFKDISNNYLDELLRKRRSFFSIVVWLVLLLTMAVFCFYIVYELLTQYYQYESYNLEFNQLSSNYTLPAITICNLNLLNYTKLEAAGLYPAYKDWIGGVGQRDSEADDTETEVNEELDQEDIYTKYRMEIQQAVINELSLFAREPKNFKDFTSLAYTEKGLCMEMNDGEQLIQRVNGAAGGLSLTLDAMTEHYLPETEQAGFLVTLRMPNETVLSQEFGFLVAPGKEYHINLRTKTVTRMTEPWGNCVDTEDIFDNEGSRSFKECYLSQMLWMFPKLRHLGCGCYPWYFYQRYIEDEEDSKYEPNIKWRLIQDWTEVMPYEYNFNFTDTCEYDESSYRPSSNRIETVTGVTSLKKCEDLCRDSSSCRYFIFSDTTNDVLNADECWLYEKGAEISKISPETKTTGLVWGDTQCYNMEQCSVSAEAACKNKIMNALMAADEDLDETGKSKTPPTCYEPCSYSEYLYDVSDSNYPTRRYWDDYLSKIVPQYESKQEAAENLVKMVFYTDQMSTITVVQTPSYEITSFIANVGGLTDLFIGLSFFTFYQFIEWLVTKTVGKLTVKKRIIDSINDIQVEDTGL